MDFFKSIFSLLGLSSRPRPIALELSALGKLPPELIIHVASFLPFDSAPSFSLCCRPIYFTLGTQYLKALENEQWHRYKFLTLLERELPNYIACYYCKKLHAISKAHGHLYPNRCTSHWIADIEHWIECLVLPEFSFTVFQMTMKVHRQGHDCSKFLNLLSLKTKTNSQLGYVEQSTALAQIVAGSLLLREQKIFMIPPTQSIPWDFLFFVCPHLTSRGILDQYGNINQNKIAPWDIPNNYQNSGRIMQCKYCLTEFRIDFKNFGGCGTAMFLTMWKDLGEGRSPLDHKWQSHVMGRGGPRWLPVEFDQGSICAAFERKEHFRFEFDSLLTLQNKKELLKKSPYRWPNVI